MELQAKDGSTKLEPNPRIVKSNLESSLESTVSLTPHTQDAYMVWTLFRWITLTFGLNSYQSLFSSFHVVIALTFVGSSYVL